MLIKLIFLVSYNIHTLPEDEGENVGGTGPVVQWLGSALSKERKSVDAVHRLTWERTQIQGHYLLGYKAVKLAEIQPMF
jgi:hypothetical protein